MSPLLESFHKGRKEKGGAGGEKEEGREEGRGRRKKEREESLHEEKQTMSMWPGEVLPVDMMMDQKAQERSKRQVT